jgi:hypothetical protein
VTKLEEYLDAELAKVVAAARKRFPPAHAAEFAGTVSGFLLATSVKLAREGGCPQAILEMGVMQKIREEYGT